MDKVRQRFVVGKMESDDFTYVGFHIKKALEGNECSQDHFVQKLQPVTLEAGRVKQTEKNLSAEEKTLFRILVGQCN